jgi:hypothetical protein
VLVKVLVASQQQLSERHKYAMRWVAPIGTAGMVFWIIYGPIYGTPQPFRTDNYTAGMTPPLE